MECRSAQPFALDAPLTVYKQYSDKITLSSGVAFDLIKATDLVGNDYAWLSTGL